MKKFIALSIFLLSFHTSVSAMELEIEDKNHILQQKINTIVGSTAQQTYEKINTNWTYVAPNDEMSIDSKFWHATWIKGDGFLLGEKQQINLPTVILKTTPENIFEALEDLINKPASLECTIALTTAKIFCMKKILGDDWFKLYATHFYQLLDSTEGWSTDQFFHELPLQFIAQVEGKPKPGSLTYITNLSCYGKYKPNGNGRGSNVFCVGDNQYIGFSGMYSNGPQTLEVIEEQDLKLLCDTQDVERGHIAHTDICKSLIESKGLFQHLRREEQVQDYNFHWIFLAQEFIDFMNTGNINL